MSELLKDPEVALVAEIIRLQLGGGWAMKLINGRNLIYGRDENQNPFLSFHHMMGMTSKSTICRVTLNALDLYDVQFYRVRNLKATVVAEAENIFADDLKNLFERTTGLYLSL